VNLNLQVSYADVPGFPPGSAVAAIQVTVTGSAPGNTTPLVETVPPGTAEVAVPLTVADTYTYAVQAIDAATPPNSYGSPISGSFSITAPVTVSLSLPSSVAASQS
jgi:hypothetical protein